MKKVAHSSLLDDLPKRIVDQSAETTAELATASGYSESHMREIVRSHIASGHWEQVFKQVNGRLVPAYRRKQQQPKP